jgi:hypothetical protein
MERGSSEEINKINKNSITDKVQENGRCRMQDEGCCWYLARKQNGWRMET